VRLKPDFAKAHDNLALTAQPQAVTCSPDQGDAKRVRRTKDPFWNAVATTGGVGFLHRFATPLVFFSTILDHLIF
jgi:hypothetical protein